MMNRAALQLLRTPAASVDCIIQHLGAKYSVANSSKINHQSSRQTRRTLSSKANVTAAAADRRLAGRRRFYKIVGIAPSDPPCYNGQNSFQNTNGSIDSPISAGIDGTQSATGVNISISNTSSWASLLQPYGSPPLSGWHTVTLDGRPIRTPLGLPLSLPSIHLALAVASEWDAQTKFLKPAQMPLMTLCCTAIDQVASEPSAHRNDVMRYLRNDTACYWADPVDDRILHRRQTQAWEGLHSSLSSKLLKLPSDVLPAQAMGGGEGLIMSRKSEGNSMSGLPHPPVLVEKAKKWVDSLDAWRLSALYSACTEAKSFLIGAGLIYEAGSVLENDEGQDDKRDNTTRDAKWAVKAARVEEEFNIETWGLVEGGHDYDRLNCSIQMHAASFLTRTVAESVLNVEEA